MSSPFFQNVDPMQPIKPSFHPFTAAQHAASNAAPVQHTQNPKIVGTSVLGMKYKDGIVLAADNLGTLTHPIILTF
jgi:20S proteasome subunit beta 7